MFAEAVTALAQGEVIAVPTEAVYGLSVDPRNPAALEKLLALKKRNPEKGFILVASDFSQLEPFIQDLPPDILNTLLNTWPGPNTWVVPARESIQPLLRGKFSTLAIRVTAHPVLSQICSQFQGALVSTSANPEGLPPALSTQKIREYFGNDLLILPGNLGGQTQVTPIKNALTGAVIR